MSSDDSKDKHSKLFLELVISLQISALQFLGKLVNPQTHKVERNLESATASIDMLDMLAVRTKGNLNPEEARFLNDTLSHLKLNYIEEMNRPPQESVQTTEKSQSPTSDKAKDAADSTKKPRADKDGEAEG